MMNYIDREHYCKKVCICNESLCDKTKCQIWKAPCVEVAPVADSSMTVESYYGKFGTEYVYVLRCDSWKGNVIYEENESHKVLKEILALIDKGYTIKGISLSKLCLNAIDSYIDELKKRLFSTI